MCDYERCDRPEFRSNVKFRRGPLEVDRGEEFCYPFAPELAGSESHPLPKANLRRAPLFRRLHLRNCGKINSEMLKEPVGTTQSRENSDTLYIFYNTSKVQVYLYFKNETRREYPESDVNILRVHCVVTLSPE